MNFNKPKLVQFADGKYGYRVRDWNKPLQHKWLDIRHSYFRNASDMFKSVSNEQGASYEYRGTLIQAQEQIEKYNGFLRNEKDAKLSIKDKGKVVGTSPLHVRLYEFIKRKKDNV